MQSHSETFYSQYGHYAPPDSVSYLPTHTLDGPTYLSMTSDANHVRTPTAIFRPELTVIIEIG